MLRKLTVLAVAFGLIAAAPALAESTEAPLLHPPGGWSFSGPFGKYDQAQLQRGFKVYREVCAQCHSLKLIAFHDLGEPGGPFWMKGVDSNENPYVKAIAASFKVPDIDTTTGDTIQRTATTADSMPPPYPNDTAAKATLGASPPDMSLLVKAREGGPDYIYSIVLGDTAAAPPGVALPPGKYYDPYELGDLSSSLKPGYHGAVAEGGIIAMPPPLTNCKVTFDDGTPCGLDQEAKDVAAFLQWASDPKLEQRKQTGLAVMIYLVLFSGVLYGSYRTIWRNVEH
jgi:ubiquinol-cytochrome c reductase cytochrome c1 subunit